MFRDVPQLPKNVFELHRPEAEVLAAGANRLRDILRLGGGQHEDDVPGRLLERLQKRVEGRIGNLVCLVQDVDLEAVAGRPVAGSLAQFPDFIDAAVGGGVDFNHVHRVAAADFSAGVAHSAGLGNRLLRGAAVESHRQDAGHRGLADSAMSAEDVPVRNALLLNGVLERPGDVLLADDVGKFLRAIFAGQDLVTHEEFPIIQSGKRPFRT